VEQKIYTLKLDAAYQPIEIIEGAKGFSMVYSGRARVLENHNEQLNALFCYPSVIVLKNYIRKRPLQLSPSRSNIYWRDEHRCQYCLKYFPRPELTLDHVFPKSRGGEKTWDNLVTCCTPCNQKKGNRTPSEASMELFRKPSRPRFTIVRTKNGIRIPPSWKKFI